MDYYKYLYNCLRTAQKKYIFETLAIRIIL
jgi:hypothetical protein